MSSFGIHHLVNSVIDESITASAADSFNPAIDRSAYKKHGIADILRKRNFSVKRKMVK
jgi:hypothetical protein